LEDNISGYLSNTVHKRPKIKKREREREHMQLNLLPAYKTEDYSEKWGKGMKEYYSLHSSHQQISFGT